MCFAFHCFISSLLINTLSGLLCCSSPYPATPPRLLGSRMLRVSVRAVEVLWRFASPTAHGTAGVNDRKLSSKTNGDKAASGFASRPLPEFVLLHLRACARLRRWSSGGARLGEEGLGRSARAHSSRSDRALSGERKMPQLCVTLICRGDISCGSQMNDTRRFPWRLAVTLRGDADFINTRSRLRRARSTDHAPVWVPAGSPCRADRGPQNPGAGGGR